MLFSPSQDASKLNIGTTIGTSFQDEDAHITFCYGMIKSRNIKSFGLKFNDDKSETFQLVETSKGLVAKSAQNTLHFVRFVSLEQASIYATAYNQVTDAGGYVKQAAAAAIAAVTAAAPAASSPSAASPKRRAPSAQKKRAAEDDEEAEDEDEDEDEDEEAEEAEEEDEAEEETEDAPSPKLHRAKQSKAAVPSPKRRAPSAQKKRAAEAEDEDEEEAEDEAEEEEEEEEEAEDAPSPKLRRAKQSKAAVPSPKHRAPSAQKKRAAEEEEEVEDAPSPKRRRAPAQKKPKRRTQKKRSAKEAEEAEDEEADEDGWRLAATEDVRGFFLKQSSGKRSRGYITAKRHIFVGVTGEEPPPGKEIYREVVVVYDNVPYEFNFQARADESHYELRTVKKNTEAIRAAVEDVVMTASTVILFKPTSVAKTVEMSFE